MATKRKVKKSVRRGKTYMEKLGLEPVSKLSIKICRERVKYLLKNIKRNKYKGKLLVKAKYYANWYKWMSKNGGNRAA